MKFFENKILFNEYLSNIKNDYIRKYLISLFDLKAIVIKLISLFILCLVIFILFFVLRSWALGNFEQLNVVFNKGWAFSQGSNLNSELVYLLKSMFTIFFFFGFVFITKWYLSIPMCIISISSLCNVIDKSIVDIYFEGSIYHYSYNTVVDYFYFSNFNFTNNIADIFIIIGIVLEVIALMYYIYNEWKNGKTNKENHSEG